nr:Holliday junction resolvase RuvX [Tissierella sp.]
MERILGLDVGDKYIGVAVSDLLQFTAQGVKTIKRVGKKADFLEIEDLIKEYDAKKVVVGLPKNMNGSVGPQSEKVIKFGEKIKNKFKIDVIYIDERMTTMSAERVLIEGNVRRENRKQYIDKIAASFILQSYLDGLQRGN